MSKYIHCYMLYDLALKGTTCIHYYYHMICLLFQMCILWHRLLFKQRWRIKTRMCIGATHTRHASHITTVLQSNISWRWRHSITWSLSSFHTAYILPWQLGWVIAQLWNTSVLGKMWRFRMKFQIIFLCYVYLQILKTAINLPCTRDNIARF